MSSFLDKVKSAATPTVLAAAGGALALGYGLGIMRQSQQKAKGPSAYHSSDNSITDSALPDFPIYRIAVTGGPCSGKSTCMEHVKEELTQIGFRVLIVPEVATILMTGGCNLMCDTSEKRIGQQRTILQTIMMMEDSYYEMAKLDRAPTVILCDRGTMDGRAYCTDEEWQSIIKRTGYSTEELRDARYDAVIHLVTAAIGAEKFYTKANNVVRRESAAEAAQLDRVTREKWAGHRMVAVIDNSTNFDEKVERVVSFIKKLIRVCPYDGEQETKGSFVKLPKKNHLKQFPVKRVDFEIPEGAEIADVTVNSLVADDINREEKVIRRKMGTSTLYYHRAERKENLTGNGHVSPNIVYVRITQEQYGRMLGKRLNPAIPPLVKTHTSFFAGERYFTLTKYWQPDELHGKVVLSAPFDVSEAEIPKGIEIEA